jgi:hypothetical protein
MAKKASTVSSPKPAAIVPSNETEVLLLLNPDQLVTTGNARFSILKFHVDELASLIEADGQVNTPIEVEALAADAPEVLEGFTHRVTVGFHRVEAVKKLRAKGLDILIPARVIQTVDAKDRLHRQISENHDRQSLSPMDEGNMMKQMMDLGYSRMDIRNAFKVNKGKKGAAMTACSNSYLNITMSFLDFPKPIQERIHDGRLGRSAAMEFQKYPKDKWGDMLEAADNARLKAFEKEEELDLKWETKHKKELESATKVETISAELTKAEADAAAAEAARVSLVKAEAEAVVLSRSKHVDVDAKKKANEVLAKASQASKAAQIEAAKKEKEVVALRKKADAIKAKVEEAKKKVADAKAAGSTTPAKGPNAPTSSAEVHAAAKAVNAKPIKDEALNFTALKAALRDLVKPCESVKVNGILKAIESCLIAGQISVNVVLDVMRVAVGEKAPGQAKAKGKK